jgi:hypothetical protein
MLGRWQQSTAEKQVVVCSGAPKKVRAFPSTRQGPKKRTTTSFACDNSLGGCETAGEKYVFIGELVSILQQKRLYIKVLKGTIGLSWEWWRINSQNAENPHGFRNRGAKQQQKIDQPCS